MLHFDVQDSSAIDMCHLNLVRHFLRSNFASSLTILDANRRDSAFYRITSKLTLTVISILRILLELLAGTLWPIYWLMKAIL